jgi:acyl-CoA thioesterase
MSGIQNEGLPELVVSAMLALDRFSQWLGIELVAVGPGRAVVRMTVRGDMLNGFGVCHGGVTFALADSALAFASNTHGHVTMSIENTIRYPKVVSNGDVLEATAGEDTVTKRLGFYRVTVRRLGDEDVEPVALFTGTVYRTNQPFFPASE